MITEKERTKLLFGPYEPPRCKRGSFLTCVLRGKVKVGGYSDAEIPWPVVWKTKSLILCGDLMEAVRRESAWGVMHHWGVCRKVVQKWRRALGVEKYPVGSRLLQRRNAMENMTPTRVRRMVEAARKHLKGRPKSANWRLRMSALTKARIRKRGAIDPNLKLWTKREERLLGTRSDEEIAAKLGRSTYAVMSRRLQLGVRRFGKTRHWWSSAEDKLLGTASDAEVAAKLGRTQSGVLYRRQWLGIKAFKGKATPARPWTKKELRMLGRDLDTVIALRLGRRTATVRAKRKDLGIKLQKTEFQPWTQEELELVGKKSDDEVAKQIGRTALAVAVKRRSLKRPFRKAR